ncbi:MAG: PAC2 family protein [Candidatus Bathyarchaeota archaeon]|nr:MAG: PAC2 family protein [Candidatus Bathyarchaeota archaeon]
MNKTEIIVLSKPKLEHPIFVEGLSHMRGVGHPVTRMLIEHVNAVKFAELYSPHFPGYAIAEDNGLCHLPRYEFYASSEVHPNLVILAGTVQPLSTDTVAYYEVFQTIFDFVIELHCQTIVTFGQYLTNQVEHAFFIASTSDALSNLITTKVGGRLFRNGRIGGLIGMVLGFAELHKLPGICILGSASEDTPWETITFPMFEYLLNVLNLTET